MQFVQSLFERRVRFGKKLVSNIYILPTIPGAIVFLTGIGLFGGAALTKNEILYLSGFSFFSIFILAMFQTHANLKKISPIVSTFSHPSTESIFELRTEIINADYHRQIKIRIYSNVYSKQLEVKELPEQFYDEHSKNAKTNAIKKWTTLVPMQSLKRGKIEEFRVMFSSRYPFGLFYVWKFFTLKTHLCITPQAKNYFEHPSFSGGEDSPSSVKPYAQGDNLKRVLWRKYSPQRTLKVRTFEEGSVQKKILNWSDTEKIENYEDRISQLFYWHLELKKKNSSHEIHFPEKEPLIANRFSNSKNSHISNVSNEHEDYSNAKFFATLPFEHKEAEN